MCTAAAAAARFPALSLSLYILVAFISLSLGGPFLPGVLGDCSIIWKRELHAVGGYGVLRERFSLVHVERGAVDVCLLVELDV